MPADPAGKEYAPRSNAERSRRTRRALLDAGRELFTDPGYARISTEAIVRRAHTTRGALFHHFPDKAGFFAAVFEEVCREYIHAVQTRMETAEGDTWERFIGSLGVLMEQLGRPSVQRIVYVDGPVVLEWSSVRHWAPDFQFLRAVFAQLRSEGFIAPLPLDLCTHLVRGMCFQAALYIARAEVWAVAQRDMTAALRRLLNGLRLEQSGIA